MRRARLVLALLAVAVLAAIIPADLRAQSGGNCSVYRTWNTGDSVTAADLNSSFTTAAVTNLTQACIDGISDSVANMQTTADPYPSGTESLATSGAGELQRLRYILQRVFGFRQWYTHTDNVDFATGSGVQGSGLGRHVTAVGLHTWAGSYLHPAITSVAEHTSGIAWVARHHLAIIIDATADQGRYGAGQTNARTWYMFHGAALTLHHTAALRFWHSEAAMHSKPASHVTAVRVSESGTDAAAATRDQLIVGHAGSALQFEGAGYTPGANRVLALAASGNSVQARQISGLAEIRHSAAQITVDAQRGAWDARGLYVSTTTAHTLTMTAHVLQLMHARTHSVAFFRVVNPTATNNIGTSGPANGGRDRAATYANDTWVHLYWIMDGNGNVGTINSPDGPEVGPNLTWSAGEQFTHWAYAGAFYYPSSAAGLLGAHVVGSTSYYTHQQTAITNGTATTETTIQLRNLVPPNATAYLLRVRPHGTTVASDLNVFLRWRSGLTFFTATLKTSVVTLSGAILMLEMPGHSQRIYYRWDNTVDAGGGLTVDVIGYRF